MKFKATKLILLLFIFALICSACTEQAEHIKTFKVIKQMDAIELSNGLTIKCKALEKQEYEKALLEGHGKLISRFKDIYNIQVHELLNKQILARDNEYYTLFYSIKDLDMIMLDANGGSNGTEMLLNKNRYGKDFPQNTVYLIKELTDELGINYTITDENLLLQIDKKVSALNNHAEFRREHFIHYIAIVGEICINKYNGEWQMELSSDGITWNPYLVIRGEKTPFFTYLYEDLFINQEDKSNLLIETYQIVIDIIKHNIS